MVASFDVSTEEFDYLQVDGVTFRARVYRPQGDGPFPAVVEVHGGAWIVGDYDIDEPINRRLAAYGIVVLAINYRKPPQGTYPCSVADLNYAVRWLKLNAQRFGSRPDWVGVMGTSAGGHLAVLAAMKPDDPRYAALPLHEAPRLDASPAFVVAMWPVICPPSRYRDNLERHAREDRLHADRPGAGLDQMKYWLTEAAMIEGSPLLALQRGDPVKTPQMLYVQAAGDELHPRHSMDRFIAEYRDAGGRVEPLILDHGRYDVVREEPDVPESLRAIREIAAFVNHSTRGRVDAPPEPSFS